MAQGLAVLSLVRVGPAAAVMMLPARFCGTQAVEYLGGLRPLLPFLVMLRLHPEPVKAVPSHGGYRVRREPGHGQPLQALAALLPGGLVQVPQLVVGIQLHACNHLGPWYYLFRRSFHGRDG